MTSPLDPRYMAAIKASEGYAPRATWDYKQNSVGYGTRAKYAGERIDRDEAERRFASEIGHAKGIVDRFAPNAPDGVKAALTSLTFNAGADWTKSGLGAAIQAGDWNAARDRFLQYNKAGGEVLPGLVSRRSSEAAWFGGDAPENSPPPPTVSHGAGPTNHLDVADSHESDWKLPSAANVVLQAASNLLKGEQRSQVAHADEAALMAQPAMAQASVPYASNAGISPTPYGGSNMSNLGKSPQMFADGGVPRQPELRNYEPGFMDEARRVGDAIGGFFGYDDLPERSWETFETAVLPALELGLAAYSTLPRGALAASGAAADARIGRSMDALAPAANELDFAAREAMNRVRGLKSAGSTIKKNVLPTTPPANIDRPFAIMPGGKQGFNAGGTVSGPLESEMGRGGRTDTLPIKVRSGAFVVPADIVSHLGQNDTRHGFSVIDAMKKKWGRPYGLSKESSPYSQSPMRRADGGMVEAAPDDGVPIIAAAGEYVFEPEEVASVPGANGDIDVGHKILSKWVLDTRKDHIKTLSQLPPPVQ